MCTAFISPTVYVLDERKSNWSTEQEKSISTIYPFDLQPSGPDDYVARTYLQFLWLPNSLMPLSYLVPSLRRVETPSTSSSIVSHPMHALLEPLLLTTRSVTKKYHSELVEILANGGGAGEMEEAMMWYAVEHETPVGVDGPAGTNAQKHGQEGDEGQWTDKNWRDQYLERMERREVQIQILLYMFKLSLPEHDSQKPLLDPDDTLKASRSGKRKRTSKLLPVEPILTVEDRLEGFMDKLAMWQLVGRIDDTFSHDSAPTKKMDRNRKDERDWTQIFVEEVVELHFKMQLPKLCKLLRTKVFPTPPFSDTESDAIPSRNESPEPTAAPRSPTTAYVPTGLPLKMTLSRSSSTSFLGAPPRAPSLSRHISSPTHPATTSLPSRNLMRSRSSSLSVSLAQEQEERAASQQTKKRGRLHREVSMTRVFRNKGKGKNLGADEDKRGSATMKIEAPKFEKTRADEAVTLVDETPIKPRIASTLEKTKNALIEPINLKIGNLEAQGDRDLTAPTFADAEDQDEEWMMDSSPVVIDPALGKQKDKGRGNDVIFTIVEGCDGSDEEWEESNLDEEKVSSAVQMIRTRSKPTRKRPRKK